MDQLEVEGCIIVKIADHRQAIRSNGDGRVVPRVVGWIPIIVDIGDGVIICVAASRIAAMLDF